MLSTNLVVERLRGQEPSDIPTWDIVQLLLENDDNARIVGRFIGMVWASERASVNDLDWLDATYRRRDDNAQRELLSGGELTYDGSERNPRFRTAVSSFWDQVGGGGAEQHLDLDEGQRAHTLAIIRKAIVEGALEVWDEVKDKV